MKRLSLLVLVVACAAPSSLRDKPHTSSFQKPFEEVWAAMVEVLGELALPIETTEEGAGRIETGWVGIDSGIDHVDCGRQAPGDLRHFSGRINVEIRQLDPAVEVDITSTFRAIMRDPATNSNYQVRCYSTGRWESEISGRLEEEIRGG